MEVTLLAVEGYERWEDSMLAKFNKFLGFFKAGFEPQSLIFYRSFWLTRITG